jgi:hypothetical protein
MGEVGFLEILDRRGRVKNRHRIVSLPITIGRAYSNDIILDDPYVSPQHARLEEHENALVVEDLDSDNGLLTDTRTRVPRLALATGMVFRVGNTEVRFCTENQSVAPTVLESRDKFDVLALISSPARRITVLAATFCVFALMFYLNSYDNVTWAEPEGAALGGMAILAVWAGGWAFGNRVVGHHFRFWNHLAWAAMSTLGLFLILIVQGYAEFIFSGAGAIDALGGLALLVWMGGVFYGHFTIIGTMPRGRRVGVAAGISLGLVAVLALLSVTDQNEFSNEIPWEGTLKPVATGLLPSITVQQFKDAASDLRTRVDRLADD